MRRQYCNSYVCFIFSDSDSDSSSSTLFSSSSSSSSAVSDEDDHPNKKDNRSYCLRTKDELPIDVSTMRYFLNSFLLTQLKNYILNQFSCVKVGVESE